MSQSQPRSPDNGPADPSVTRQTLLLRLKADAPTAREVAWREFYQTYSPVVAGFARRMGVRPHDVADLMQDVMLGFFSVSPEFVYDPAKGRFRGYLKTCTWRIFQRRLGQQMKVAGRRLVDVDPAEVQVEAVWNDVWEGEKLQRALAAVRERYSARPDKAVTFKAFELYALLERPAEDVARELGLSVDSVHQAKRRVSQAIKLEMETMSHLGE